MDHPMGRIDAETRNWKNPKRTRTKQGAGGRGATAEAKPERSNALAGSSAESLLALETRALFSVSAAVRSRDRAGRREDGRAGGRDPVFGGATRWSVRLLVGTYQEWCRKDGERWRGKAIDTCCESGRVFFHVSIYLKVCVIFSRNLNVDNKRPPPKFNKKVLGTLGW
jgi:hypothetical protein